MPPYTTTVKKTGLGKTPNEVIDILVLCASASYLKDLGNRSLISINGKPLLSHQLDTLRQQFPYSNIWLGLGFEAERVYFNYSEYRAIENEFFETTNICRTIGLALKAIKPSNLLIVPGDLYFRQNPFYKIENRACTLFANESTRSPCLIFDEYVKTVSFKLKNKNTWFQILYLTSSEIAFLKEICFNRNNDKMVGLEMMNELVFKGAIIKPIEVDSGSIVEIRDVADIKKCEQS